jgi:hypothetical protein
VWGGGDESSSQCVFGGKGAAGPAGWKITACKPCHFVKECQTDTAKGVSRVACQLKPPCYVSKQPFCARHPPSFLASNPPPPPLHPPVPLPAAPSAAVSAAVYPPPPAAAAAGAVLPACPAAGPPCGELLSSGTCVRGGGGVTHCVCAEAYCACRAVSAMQKKSRVDSYLHCIGCLCK